MIEGYSIEELTASTTCAGEMDSSFGRRRKLFFDTAIVLWLTMTTPEIQTSMNLVRKVQRNNFNYKTNEQNCSSIRHIRIWSELQPV